MIFGAIIGDIVGSRYEFMPIKSKEFELFTWGCRFTDDTVMTVAVAEALLTDRDFAGKMRQWGRRYPNAGYGGRFAAWLLDENPEPYGSWGNGSAMRVSPCGMFARSMEEALALAKASAEVTHDHPEGIRGAQAVAAAVYLAKSGAGREEIRDYIEENFYPLDKNLAQIRPGYRFDVSCQGSVPQAIQAFLESTDFEDAIRNAVSLGGDSDTIAAITGSIAWMYYKRRYGITAEMRGIRYQAAEYLPREMLRIAQQFAASIDMGK